MKVVWSYGKLFGEKKVQLLTKGLIRQEIEEWLQKKWDCGDKRHRLVKSEKSFFQLKTFHEA